MLGFHIRAAHLSHRHPLSVHIQTFILQEANLNATLKSTLVCLHIPYKRVKAREIRGIIPSVV